MTARLPPPVHAPWSPAPATVAPAADNAASARQIRLQLLEWAFTLFSAARVLAYLPTTWAIMQCGDSRQHSLWTWCTWLGANATMAAWLHVHNGQRARKAVLVSAGNAVMCAVMLAVILLYRV